MKRHRTTKKVEQVGLQKKVRTAPTNTSLLPPCKVCLEPAAGFHYGANTCEACKGFFRRSLLREKPYNCLGIGNCNIRAGKRQICPKCRLDKCLSVGMSKEAIKTGRYTHAKRTQDIIEYHQMMGKSLENSHLISMTSTSTLSTSCSSSTSLSPELSASLPSCALSPDSEPSTQTPASLNSAADIFDGPFELSNVASEEVFSSSVFQSPGRDDEAYSPSSTLVSVPPPTSSSPVLFLVKEQSSMSLKRTDVLNDEETCKDIVNYLLQIHNENPLMPYDNFTIEEIQERQRACHEACKLKSDMFGCVGLSHAEYLDFYKNTGLDVDNRLVLWTNLTPMLETNIQKYIAFVKKIPRFAELTIRDQINLIKNNRCEVRMMCSYAWYNYETKVMTFESGRTVCIHELAKLMGMDHCVQRFKCAHAIRRMGLTKEELILLKCLMVVTAGAEDLEEPEKVSTIQWQLAQCLRWLFQQTRHDADLMFARAMSGICYIRELSVGFYEWLRSNPAEHVKSIENNALLAEWFSNS